MIDSDITGKLLGIDLDGTIADWTGAVIAGLQERGFNPPRQEDITTYHFQDMLDTGMKRAMFALAKAPGFFQDLDIYPGAQDTILTLRQLGVEVFFVTSPYLSSPTCYDEKVRWVTQHFGAWARERVVLTLDKTLVDLDVLVDDKPSITGAGKSRWQRVVFDQPYNQAVEGPRMRSWNRDYGVVVAQLLGDQA